MERRVGLRGRTDFPVTLAVGHRTLQVRGIELSAAGIIVDRRRPLDPMSAPLTVRLSIRLPERRRSIEAIARHVRCFDSQQVLRFVELADADRLTLAEHLDIVHLRGTALN
jgi:hypothetical protein